MLLPVIVGLSFRFFHPDSINFLHTRWELNRAKTAAAG